MLIVECHIVTATLALCDLGRNDISARRTGL